MQVDLGSVQPITRVKLTWEAAFASAYQIQVSNNPNGPWTVAYDNTAGAGGVEDLKGHRDGKIRAAVRNTARHGIRVLAVGVPGLRRLRHTDRYPHQYPHGHTHRRHRPLRGLGPDTAYHVGDRVSYNGLDYQCQQAHTSIVTWEPPNTPALWSRL